MIINYSQEYVDSRFVKDIHEFKLISQEIFRKIAACLRIYD